MDTPAGPDSTAGHKPDLHFSPTRWSLVQRAVDPAHPDTRAALSELVEVYWQPVYFFVRRRGHDADAARDLTQEFFCRLLEKGGLADASPERGRFRTYLLGAVKFFLSDEADRAHAQKRGGGRAPLSLDFARAESQYAIEPKTSEPADALLNRMWARELVDRALARLERQLADEGRATIFAVLRLSLAPNQPSYAEIAKALGISEADVTNHLHRARKRFRQALLAEVLPSTGSLAEAEVELRELFG